MPKEEEEVISQKISYVDVAILVIIITDSPSYIIHLLDCQHQTQQKKFNIVYMK